SQSGSASFEDSVKRVSSRSTGLSQTLNWMEIHRKEPLEPVSKGSSTSADPPEPVSKDHSPPRDPHGPILKDHSLSSDAPEPVSKDHSPSTEAPEIVHKHSNKGNIPSASTSTSSQAQTQTSRPKTRSQTQTSLTHHTTCSHIHQAHTPRESIPKTKRKRGAVSNGIGPESENGEMEDEAGLTEEGEEERLEEGKESRPCKLWRKGGGE
ncbi:MAG: hypothetical protein Q9180_002163, partial [Flavoplaca navasiana]